MAILKDIRPSILDMSDSDVMALHRTIRNNRMYVKPKPERKSKAVKEKKPRKAKIDTMIGNMSLDELEAILAKMEGKI